MLASRPVRRPRATTVLASPVMARLVARASVEPNCTPLTKYLRTPPAKSAVTAMCTHSLRATALLSLVGESTVPSSCRKARLMARVEFTASANPVGRPLDVPEAWMTCRSVTPSMSGMLTQAIKVRAL